MSDSMCAHKTVHETKYLNQLVDEQESRPSHKHGNRSVMIG